MATTRERTRCRERLHRLSESTLDCVALRFEADDVALLADVGSGLGAALPAAWRAMRGRAPRRRARRA